MQAYTIVGLVSGAIFFQEFVSMTPLSAAMFSLGILLMLFGMFISITPTSMTEGVRELKAAAAQSENQSCTPRCCSAPLGHAVSEREWGNTQTRAARPCFWGYEQGVHCTSHSHTGWTQVGNRPCICVMHVTGSFNTICCGAQSEQVNVHYSRR